jgi:hypothetical protein
VFRTLLWNSRKLNWEEGPRPEYECVVKEFGQNSLFQGEQKKIQIVMALCG